MGESTRPKRIKIVDRLFRIGDKYVYRCGDDERVLGAFTSDEKAIKAKELHEATRDSLGASAFKFRLKHVWNDYYAFRENQAAGTVKGRKKIAGGTLKEIDSIWENHLLKFFGNRFFADINDQLWAKYCDRATVGDLRNHRKVLGGYLRWVKITKGYIRVLPEFEIPEVVSRKLKVLTRDQIIALVTNAHGTALPFVAMYLFMGIRRGEQMHLRWDDIDFVARALQVRDETTRTRKGRPVPINEFVAQILLRRLAEQRAADLVTPYVYPRRGQPSKHMRADGIASAWRTTLKRAGLTNANIRPHDLRATYEHYANKLSDFTDMQREKMVGASIKIQAQRYVTFDADDVRGLEQAVSFDGLSDALNNRLLHASTQNKHGKKTGKRSRKSSVDIENSNE
jgi:integrase